MIWMRSGYTSKARAVWFAPFGIAEEIRGQRRRDLNEGNGVRASHLLDKHGSRGQAAQMLSRYPLVLDCTLALPLERARV